MSEITNEVKSAPSFERPKDLLVRYAEVWGEKLTAEQISSVKEIGRRLDRLNKLAERLVFINNELLKRDCLTSNMKFENDSLVIEFGGEQKIIKFNRKDPNVPVELIGHTIVSAYSANSEEKDSDETVLLLKEDLEDQLESYYQNAHRVLNMIKYLPGITKLKCDAIMIVRNKLVEHTEGRHIYSFGYGNGGPVVKPIKPSGASEFHDRGLLKNSQVFIEALATKLQSAIDNA